MKTIDEPCPVCKARAGESCWRVGAERLSPSGFHQPRIARARLTSAGERRHTNTVNKALDERRKQRRG